MSKRDEIMYKLDLVKQAVIDLDEFVDMIDEAILFISKTKTDEK